MNQEIKKRWVKALRSGKYKQGICSLQDEGSFCCLGVLCDVVKDDNGIELVFNKIGEIFGGNLSEQPTVEAESGLTSEQQGVLIRMNDTSSTFDDIANYIEVNL